MKGVCVTIALLLDFSLLFFLDYHLKFQEWVRPKPPARLNIFPKFPAMSTPLPTWLPYDQEPDDEIDEGEL
jgi:hypothetical protein